MPAMAEDKFVPDRVRGLRQRMRTVAQFPRPDSVHTIGHGGQYVRIEGRSDKTSAISLDLWNPRVLGHASILRDPAHCPQREHSAHCQIRALSAA